MKFAKKPSIAYFLATLGADALFFGFTNPSKVATVWLMIGFMLAIVSIYWISRGLVALLGLYSKVIRRQHTRLVRAFTISGAALVALQSIGQLTLRDLAVLLPLVIVGYFYLSYARAGQPRA